MPRFSVVIPAYNNARYLSACLDSIVSQDFSSWEAIVVIDGSPDNSSEIASEYASNEPRIKVLNKLKNEGTHRARMSGVLSCQGEYVFLLDADDEMAVGALGKLSKAFDGSDADILHFGINVIGVDINEEDRRVFERYINRDVDVLEGDEICAAAYDERCDYVQDWRVTQRVYKRSLIKRAYCAMTKESLGRGQDGYEYFVISSIASKQITRNDIIGLDYYYGRGVNGDVLLSCDDFLVSARDFKAAIDSINRYAVLQSSIQFGYAKKGGETKLIELVMNEWHNRLSEDGKKSALTELKAIFGSECLAVELMRLVRDDAYKLWISENRSLDFQVLKQWFDIASGLKDIRLLNERYEKMRCAAEGHLKDISIRVLQDKYAHQKIRIFVSAHKDIATFDSAVLQPIQVGAALAGQHYDYMLKDDTGESISNLNPMYCELTAQYWAWKNVDAEYYGFCHYRRYFNFSQDRYRENSFGEILHGSIDAEAQKLYGLDDKSIEKTIKGFDVITTEFKKLVLFPDAGRTPREHYEKAPQLHIADLERAMRILSELYPEYAIDAEAYLDGSVSCFCNMFIMRKKIFCDYSAWLFSILDRYMEQSDMSLYGVEALRTPGHLAERLLNVYYNHHMRIGSGWRVKQLQCVHFEYPDRHQSLLPASFVCNQKPIIPVVFASDNNYVPMLTTAIQSMIKNASSDFNYDVAVLEKDISFDRKLRMEKFLSDCDNVYLRFVNVRWIVAQYSLQTNNEHISNETYYRFLIQELLPFYDKVLYLDSDLVVRGDISELFNTDLGNDLIGAIKDLDYLGNLNMNDNERIEYSRQVLHLHNPYEYFQAGVLLINTKEMRKLRSVREWLEIMSDSEYLYDDQDILNSYCQSRVRFLPFAWNVMNDCGGRVKDVFSFAPASVFKDYLASRENPKIIHYAGFEKPWNTIRCDQSEEYWTYARKTPFYEELLRHANPVEEERLPDRTLGENNVIRNVVDPIAPVGSKRREVAKAILRAARGR